MGTAANQGSSLVWMRSAACSTGQAPDLPWLTDAPLLPAAAVADMRTVCAGCPVATACASYADHTGVTGGFWAGTDRDTVSDPPAQLPLPLDEVAALDGRAALGGAA